MLSWNDNQVTVHAGIQLKDLIKALKKLPTPMGLRNMGSVTEQTLAGAISTGTHGTGLRLGAMPTQVRGLRLVDGQGQVHELDDSTPERLRAARLSIGLFGIITRITLECVPYYDLDYDIFLCDFDDVVDDVARLSQENERVLLWWRIPLLPKRKVAIVTKNAPGTGGREVLPHAQDLTQSVGKTLSERAPTRDLEDLAEAVAERGVGDGCKHLVHRSGGYEKMLTIPLLPVYHRECEYAIPAEAATRALKALRTVLDEADAKLRLPIEVRFVAADQDPLSPAYGRDVCYIGVATLDNATEVFERVEPIMKDLGGRPHWGKHFNLTRAEAKAMYPTTFDAFVELRRQFDPQGVFLNTLLRRLFE